MAALLLMGFSTVAVGLPYRPPPSVSRHRCSWWPCALCGVRGRRRMGRCGALCVENAPRRLRGRCCMVMQLGHRHGGERWPTWCSWCRRAPTGANSAFLSWGWRMPFLLSAVLIAVARTSPPRRGDGAGTQAAEPGVGGPADRPLLRGQGKQLPTAGRGGGRLRSMLYRGQHDS